MRFKHISREREREREKHTPLSLWLLLKGIKFEINNFIYLKNLKKENLDILLRNAHLTREGLRNAHLTCEGQKYSTISEWWTKLNKKYIQ